MQEEEGFRRAVSFSGHARQPQVASSLQDSPASDSLPRTTLRFVLGYTVPRPWRSGGPTGRCNLAWDGAQRSPRSGTGTPRVLKGGDMEQPTPAPGFRDYRNQGLKWSAILAQ